MKNILVRCYSFNFLHLQKCKWTFLKVGGKTLFWPNFSCGYYLISSLSLWQNSLKVSLFSRSPVPLLQCSLNILLLGFCFHYSSETDLSRSPMTSTSTLLNPMIVSQFLIFIYYLQHFTLLISLLPETFSSFQDNCLIFLLLFQILLSFPFPGALHLPWPLNTGLCSWTAHGHFKSLHKCNFFSVVLSGHPYLKLQPYT